MFTMKYARADGNTFLTTVRKMKAELFKDIWLEKQAVIDGYTVDAIRVTRIDGLEHCSGMIQAMYPQWTMDAAEDIWDQVPWDNPDEQKIQELILKTQKQYHWM